MNGMIGMTGLLLDTELTLDYSKIEAGHLSMEHLDFDLQVYGIGIPQDKVGLLFNKSSQVDASIARKFGGTGLGLAISKQLAEMMGGQVGVHSTPDQGAEFWFTARFVVQEATDEAPPRAAVSLTGLHVLVVDFQMPGMDGAELGSVWKKDWYVNVQAVDESGQTILNPNSAVKLDVARCAIEL